MKQKLLLKVMLLLCALVAGSSSVWAEKFEKITSSSDLVANAEYLLVSGTEAYSGISSNIGQHVTVTFDTNGDITNKSTAHVLKLGGSSNAWTFYDETDKKYIAYTSTSTSSNNNLYQVTSNTANGATWTLAVTTSAVKMQNNYNTGRWMRYNSDRFCCYYKSGSESTTGTAVTLYKKVNFTVTATVNDADMGSASVDGITITASPNDGYRVISGDGGYTVTSGTATVTHTGNSNTLTVNPSSICTVQVNFEAIPTHTITCVADPDGAGTFDAASSTYEGATTEIRATANSGYKFKSWSISGTGASLSSTSTNPTTLTMGTANATVTATFEPVTTHAITYSVNGITNTVNVEENTDVDLSAPASGIPVGYVFIGWRTATLTETNTNPDDYVYFAKSTEDITYYAVMAVRTSYSPDTYEQLTSDSFDANAKYVIGGLQGGSGDGSSTMWYLNSYQAVDADVAWGVCTSTPSTVTPVTFSLSGTAAELVAKDNSGNYLAISSEVKKFAMSSTSTTVYLNTDGAIKSAASDGWLMRYNHNNGNGGLRWYNSTTGQQAYFYKVIDNCTYANYCTSLPSSSIIDPHATYMTLTSKYPLDFTNVNNLTAYIVTDDNASDGYVTLTQVNKVPANTGLVLKASSTVSPISVDVLAGAADDVSGNLMAGSAFSTTAIAANAGYILKGGAFHPSSGGDLPEGKAYLNIAVSASAPILNLDFGGETTGINAVNGSEFKVNGEYYNLAGQRVAQPTKGLYIVNGKKVIIK